VENTRQVDRGKTSGAGPASPALAKKMKQSSGKNAADITLDFSFRRVRTARACGAANPISRFSRISIRASVSPLPLAAGSICRASRFPRSFPPTRARIDDGTRRRQFTGPRYRSYFSSGVCDRQTIPADGPSAFRREFGSGARRVPFVCRAALV